MCELAALSRYWKKGGKLEVNMNEEVSNLSSSPQDLAAMIAVQPKAVVSRTLVNKPTGTVTLFAFRRRRRP